jgi:hypothetical protein
MVDASFVFRQFHVDHIAQPPHLLRLSSDHMHHLALASIDFHQLMEPLLFVGGQRGNDEELRSLEYEFLQ